MSGRQLWALVTSAARELAWGLRLVEREHARWVRAAEAIEDPGLRGHALGALADKRPLLDGAAMFWTIPDRRSADLLRLLVAFQVLANYHDNASERAGAGVIGADGRPGSSMATFVEVVDLARPPSSYRDDRFLAALVETCRLGCAGLPGYALARPHLVRAARRARSLDVEHVADPGLRSDLLRRFAAEGADGGNGLSWFERTAGSSSLLTAIASLAVAARHDCSAADLDEVVKAYAVVAALSALLDNYVDEGADAASGNHNYLAYYTTPDAALARLAGLVEEALAAVGHLRRAERHRVIVASMVAMYLTSDGARAAGRSEATRLLAGSGGSLVAGLLPILSLWRAARREGSA